jgi:HAD superfamily hydrolase (TIGR01509 family)
VTIDWLVVDLGGVAAHFRPERRLDALAAATRLDADVIDQRLFGSGLDHDAELGRHDTDSIVNAVLAALDYRIDQQTMIDCWSLAFEPDGALLNEIGRYNVRRALFTNNGPLLDLCLTGPLAGLAATFDTALCSWHLGATKPDPDAFDRAADQLASAPKNLLLIDDSPANVMAAQVAGWKAECFADHAALHRVLNARL